MDAHGPLTPAEALRRADDGAAATRRAGRWRVVGWWILTVFMTVHLLGDRLYPEFIDDWSLVFLGVTMLLLGSLLLFARVFDRRGARADGWFVVAMVATMVLATLLLDLVVPPGVMVWAFALAALPVAVCAVATARFARS